MSDFGDTSELVPDLPEPIRGYRSWPTDGGRLLGQGDVIWPAGEPLRARCAAKVWPSGEIWLPSAVPAHDCPSPDAEGHHGYGCGIYAYKSPARFADQSYGEPGIVVGCVELGGKVYEHEHGYRAEYAMPVCFYGDPADEMLAFLAAVYGVPIEPPPWRDPEVVREQINRDAAAQDKQWAERIADADRQREREREREREPAPSSNPLAGPAYGGATKWGWPTTVTASPSFRAAAANYAASRAAMWERLAEAEAADSRRPRRPWRRLVGPGVVTALYVATGVLNLALGNQGPAAVWFAAAVIWAGIGWWRYRRG